MRTPLPRRARGASYGAWGASWVAVIRIAKPLLVRVLVSQP